MKPVLIVIGVLVAAFFAIGIISAASPDGQARIAERHAIDACWGGHERKSNSAEVSQFIAGACEKMEADYRTKWNREP